MGRLKMKKLVIATVIATVLVLGALLPLRACTSISTNNALTIETCQEYFERRLSEGWTVVERDGFNVVIQSPDGNIRRPIDLRNDVETLRPSAVGDEENLMFGTSGDTFHWQDVDEASPDGDTTRVNTDWATYQRDLYNIANSGVGAGTINSVKVYAVCTTQDSSPDQPLALKIAVKTGGTAYESSEISLSGADAYTSYSNTWETNPGGGDWSWVDIDALQVGIAMRESDTGNSDRTNCTQVYVEIGYTSIVAPTVTTQAVTDIASTTATGNGNITATGGEDASAWGVCYNTTGNPTTANGTAAGSGAGGAGAFTAAMTSLTPGQIYYVKAYATNSEGTSYGAQVDFYTLPGDPAGFSATTISDVRIDLAWTKGAGGDKTMVRRKEVSYPTGPADGDQVYFDTGVSYSDTGRDPGTEYFYRIWAYDTEGTQYSSGYASDSATTYGSPTVTSQAATNVEETTATWNGDITSIGGVNADYRGFVWGTTSKVDPGNIAPADTEYDSLWIQSGSYGTGVYDYNVVDLTPGTTWYFRACAHNPYGWDYSNTERMVYTKPGNPSNLVATAVSASQIDLTWTIGTGSEKSMVRRKTVSYPTDPADGIQVYFDTEASCNDTSLDQGVTYFYRVWAWDTNSGYSDGYSEDLETTPVGDLYLRLWYQPSTIITDTGFAGTADAGSSNVKIIDAELTQADDYWNLARLIIVTTDDHLAPEGETAVITDFLAATDELQFAALGAAVEAGDTYTIDFGILTDRIVNSGTADSGSATTLRDDALIEADNYWNNMILEILTTTDGLAPQGEIAVITDFIAADDELQFADLTAAVGAGDTYELRSDGRITWGNNPDDLAATFGGIVPYGQPTPGITEPESPDMIAPHVSPGMFTESPGTNMPGYGLFKFVSDGSGIPIQVLWFGIGFILSIALGVVVWVMTSEAGGRGDMLWTAVASGLVLSLFTVMGDGLIPAWTLIVYAIVAVGMILAQKFISI